jgi:hypothetical protein
LRALVGDQSLERREKLVEKEGILLIKKFPRPEATGGRLGKVMGTHKGVTS